MASEIFERGAIAMDSGELLKVTNVKLDYTNNGKLVHTMRKTPAGQTQGTKEGTVSFDAVIGSEGEEADWFKLVKKGTIKQVRIKIPGRTVSVEGMYKDLGLELPLDDAIKVSMTFIGSVEF